MRTSLNLILLRYVLYCLIMHHNVLVVKCCQCSQTGLSYYPSSAHSEKSRVTPYLNGGHKVQCAYSYYSAAATVHVYCQPVACKFIKHSVQLPTSTLNMLPHNIHLRCADLMNDLLQDTRHLAGRVTITVRIYQKHYGCLVKTKVVRKRDRNEVFVCRLWRRVDDNNVASVHMFFGRVQDLANSLYL